MNKKSNIITCSAGVETEIVFSAGRVRPDSAMLEITEDIHIQPLVTAIGIISKDGLIKFKLNKSQMSELEIGSYCYRLILTLRGTNAVEASGRFSVIYGPAEKNDEIRVPESKFRIFERMLDSKADKADTYTKDEINKMLSVIDGGTAQE